MIYPYMNRILTEWHFNVGATCGRLQALLYINYM